MTRIPYAGRFRVTLPYGAPKNDLWSDSGSSHQGIDLCGLTGLKIYSTVCGIVEFAGDRGDSFGNYVCVCESGTKRRHLFCHLSDVRVKKGAFITPFTIIGSEGSSGHATSRHLHYEIRDMAETPYVTVNPADFMHISNSRGIYTAENYNMPQKGEKLITRRYPFDTIEKAWIMRSDTPKNAAEWQLESGADQIFNLSDIPDTKDIPSPKEKGALLLSLSHIISFAGDGIRPLDFTKQLISSSRGSDLNLSESLFDRTSAVVGAPCLIWDRHRLQARDFASMPAEYYTAICLYPGGLAVIQGGKVTPSELADYALWDGMTHVLLQSGKTNTIHMQNGKVSYSPDGGRQISAVLCLNIKKPAV